MAKFNIINKAEKVVDYVLTITEKAPKKLRCDIVPELRKQAVRIMEDIVRANFIVCNENTFDVDKATRLGFQKDCQATIRVLEATSEICNSHSYVTNHQLEVLTKHTQELFDMVSKWILSDEKRCTVERLRQRQQQ